MGQGTEKKDQSFPWRQDVTLDNDTCMHAGQGGIRSLVLHQGSLGTPGLSWVRGGPIRDEARAGAGPQLAGQTGAGHWACTGTRTPIPWERKADFPASHLCQDYPPGAWSGNSTIPSPTACR